MAGKKDQIRERTGQAVKAQDQEIQAFLARLGQFLQSSLRKLLKGLTIGEQSARDAAGVLSGISDSLVEMGLSRELEELHSLYGKELGRIRDEYQATTGKRFVLTEADVTLTETLVKFDTAILANSVDGRVDELRAILLRSVITGVLPDIASMAEDIGAKTAAEGATILRTGLMGFNRAVSMAKAKEDFGPNPLFLYIGPDDKVTRPFCHARVDKVFDQKTIDSWDNGTDLPANIYCGGYNCRHHLRPVSKQLAEELGGVSDVQTEG